MPANKFKSLLAALLLGGLSQPSLALLSDGSDGAFNPTGATTLVADADGVFNFTQVDIPDPVLVSVLAGDWGGDVQLLASGDIRLDGYLDFGALNLHLVTPGSIRLSGGIYGSGSLYLEAGLIELTDNPNGGPDLLLENGGSLVLTADGELGTGGSVTTSLVDPGIVFELWVEDPNQGGGSAGLTFTFNPITTPLPPALFLLPGALLLVPRRRQATR